MLARLIEEHWEVLESHFSKSRYSLTCCIQGWLGKDKNSPQVKDDKFFGQLLDNDISFVNSTYSNVLEEVKGSMISLCLKYYKSNMKGVGAEGIMLKVMEDYSFSLENNLIKEIKNQLEIKKNQIETEEVEGTDRQLISNNSWLSEFLTTNNINETSRIGAFEFDNDY